MLILIYILDFCNYIEHFHSYVAHLILMLQVLYLKKIKLIFICKHLQIDTNSFDSMLMSRIYLHTIYVYAHMYNNFDSMLSWQWVPRRCTILFGCALVSTVARAGLFRLTFLCRYNTFLPVSSFVNYIRIRYCQLIYDRFVSQGCTLLRLLPF